MSSDTIWDDIQKIVLTKSNDFRVKMDGNVHCMDVGIAALKASDPSITYADKEKLHRLFRKEFFLSASLEGAILHCKNTDNVDRSLFVEDPSLGDYIIGPSYAALRARTSKALKSSKLGSSFTGVDTTTGSTVTNIGHLSLKDSSAATTPLETKLGAILKALQGAPIASAMVASKIKQLHKYHKADTSYAFNRPSFDINRLQEILGSGTVFVTLQTSIKNSALAKMEAGIELAVRSYLTSDKFHQKILKKKGSNSILEDITEGLAAALSGNSKRVPGSTHTAKPTKKSSTPLLPNKAPVFSKIPPIRNLQGKFYSLNSLQVLLDRHLQDVISANMGDQGYPGGQRKILNYRTGRFAASARVERLTQSREGLITAFYSYMKNPYQVFEPGHKMGSPLTRDPKLLISKSIREVAATVVGNRMRAVSI